MTLQRYWIFFGVIALARLPLASTFPLLSDESLHILWGFFPSWGHSDHPGMTGWLQALTLWIGPWPWVYRLSCLLFPMAVTELIRRFLETYDANKARWVALCYFLSPLSFFQLFYTPETPLLLFVVLSFLCLFKAHQKQSLAWAILAGLFQSFAILSKYNALWYGVAAFVFFVLRPGSRNWKLTLAYGLGCLPSFAMIFMHNYEHCWINWTRFSHRIGGDAISWKGVASAFWFQLILALPWGWWAFFRRRERLDSFSELRRILPLFFFIPWACLVYVSFKNKIGIHWMQAFYPFFFMMLIECSERILKMVFRLSAGLTAILSVVVFVFLAIPLETYGKWFPRYHHDFVIAFEPKSVCEALEKEAGPDGVIGTFDYSQSSTLWINCRRQVLRYGFGALDGRDFDRITDYRALDGKPIALVWQNLIDEGKAGVGIVNPRFGNFEAGGKTFHFVSGQFSYENYRGSVLQEQLNSIYDGARKAHLPNDRCYFKRRYFE